MTRNRVRYYAEQRGWTLKELWGQVRDKREDDKISQSTVGRLFRESEYVGNIASLEALARVFGVKVTELLEDV